MKELRAQPTFILLIINSLNSSSNEEL